MSKVSGRFSKKFLKSTKHWKKFFEKNGDLKDTEYREYYDWNELLEKVEDQKERTLIEDLLKKCLSLSPKERLSASDILAHSWCQKNSDELTPNSSN